MFETFSGFPEKPFTFWDVTSWNLRKLGDNKLTVGVISKFMVLDLISWSYFLDCCVFDFQNSIHVFAL